MLRCRTPHAKALPLMAQGRCIAVWLRQLTRRASLVVRSYAGELGELMTSLTLCCDCIGGLGIDWWYVRAWGPFRVPELTVEPGNGFLKCRAAEPQ